MAIPSINEAQLIEVLNAHLSPSQEIKEPERLVGREKYLTQIRRALMSPGRHVFIYGERGVGKTSLIKTARKLATENDSKNFIYIPCGEKPTFFEVVGAVGNSVIALEKRVSGQSRGFSFGLNAPGSAGLSFSRSGGPAEGIAAPTTMSGAMDVLRYVQSQLKGQIIVSVDELDRVQNKAEKTGHLQKPVRFQRDGDSLGRDRRRGMSWRRNVDCLM